MSGTQRWVGIDQGWSQMGLAVLGAADDVLVVHRTREPSGNGHDHATALARLRGLLARADAFRHAPVHLAGFCYEGSGVAETFAEAGWTVAGTKALNDVVGPYGLTPMPGHVVAACCGTYSQVVYVDDRHAIRWAGGDVRLPDWHLCGEAYAGFLVERARTAPATPLARAVRDTLGGTLPPAGEGVPTARWADLGPLLSAAIDSDPAARAFLTRAAAAVVDARNVLCGAAKRPDRCPIVLGGGAVADDRLWAFLSEQWRAVGVRVDRAAGEPSVGLARYARRHPDADPWSHVGSQRPGWLS
jgi:hypothetical protein